MEQVTQVPDLHRSIADWKGEVNVVRGEFSQLSHRLERVAGRFTQRASLAKVEHFQNQLICQKEVADELFHDLKQVSKRFLNSNLSEQGRRDEELSSYDRLRDRMETFKKLFSAMSSEFNEFMEKSS